MKSNIDIIFIDGLEPRALSPYPSNMGSLFALCAVLEEKNYNYKILNASTLYDYNCNGLIKELDYYNFKTIGISTNCDNIRYVYKITDAIKKKYPNIPIIVGGPQTTFSDLKTLRETKIDVVVKHDGEIKLIKLLDYYLKKQGNLNEILGISYKEGNTIISNEEGMIPDIDSLPLPKYEILVNEKYWITPKKCVYDSFSDFLSKLREINTIFVASRGCPYRCTFCVEGNMKTKSRHKSVENTMRDLEHFLAVTGSKFVLFGDDTFTSSKKRVIDMCEKIKNLRKKYNFSWYAEGRVNVLAKFPELIEIMINAGLVKLQLGIESGSQKSLDAYNKQITLEQIERVIKECSKYDNLLLHGNIILGSPFESFEDLKESINFAKKLIHLSNYSMDFLVGYLTPFVGTQIRENPEKFNLEILYEDFEFYKFPFSDKLLKPKEMTLIEYHNIAYYASSDLNQFFTQSVLKLDKSHIDRILSKFAKDEELGHVFISKMWEKMYTNFFLLKSYYKFYNQEIVYKNFLNIDYSEIINLVPMRLWDIDYDVKESKYFFTSLSGQLIELENHKKELWEMATGKYSIKEINDRIGNQIDLNNESSLKIIADVYLYLEHNFAIGLINYRK